MTRKKDRRKGKHSKKNSRDPYTAEAARASSEKAPSTSGDPTSREWNVYALVAGPRLPDSDIKFGPAGISRISKGTAARIDQTIPQVTHEISNAPHYVSVFSSYAEMKTEWLLRVEVTAEDVPGAQEAAEEEALPLALGLLDTATDSWRPYRARVVRVENAKTGERGVVFSSIAIPLTRRETLGHEDVAELHRRFLRLEENVVARNALRRMREAIDLDDRTSGFHDLVVLRFFTAIEGIVDDVVSAERPAALTAIENDLAAVTTQLEDMLSNTVDLSDRVHAIRQATGKIRELTLETMKTRIQIAGQKLGLDAGLMGDTVKLAVFRNKYLGHFSSEIPQDELGPWAGHRAFEVCKAFVRAFLDYSRDDPEGEESPMSLASNED
jgi:hypothetical protein